jgi:molecular chaperone HtpG
VYEYLAQVAPVPFHADFRHGEKIISFLKEHDGYRTPLQIEIEGEGLVYRPHRDHLVVNGKDLPVGPLETAVSSDRNGETSSLSWILHHGYQGALPKSSLVSGWRMRSGDIQVGGNDLLEDLYPESRFNSWTIAETHVLDKKLVPNGRRDNYEHSAHLSDLLTRLNPIGKDVAHRCRTSSIVRNAFAKVEASLMKCEEEVAIAAKKRTPGFVVENLRREVTACLTNAQKVIDKGLLEHKEVESFEQRIKRLSTKLENLPEDTDILKALDDFTPVQRQLLHDVIETIYMNEVKAELADKLVGKILQRLRSKRSRK